MNDKNKEEKVNNKMTQALNNFEIARKAIQQTLDNLQNAQKNLKSSNASLKGYQDIKKADYVKGRSSFNKPAFAEKSTNKGYQDTQKNDYLKGLSSFNNPTFDEKAKLLEKQFIPCIFEDELNNKMIIFDERKYRF